VKLLGRKKDVGAAGNTDANADLEGPVTSGEGAAAPNTRGHTTAPKGRPTPRRDEATGGQRRRGPVAPAPMTSAEARARRKAMAGPKLSREQRRSQKEQRRDQIGARRERMMAGDEDYLLPRDRGPVRRFARDVVDARRNLLGLFMPTALTLLFFGMGVPQLQFYIYPAMLLLMVAMLVDGLILARKVARQADANFPENVESRWKLGLYVIGRASQLRRTRVPRPQVDRGARLG
jgi:hypothetical protein